MELRPGSKKWDFYIICFTLARSNVSKRDPVLVPCWDLFCKQKKNKLGGKQYLPEKLRFPGDNNNNK